MNHLPQNLHFAFRQLARRPAFTLVAVLTLALGIGANTAIFSVVNSVLLRPLPYGDSDRLVVVWNSLSGTAQLSLSEPELLDYREGVGSLEGLGAYRLSESNLTGGLEPERVPSARVTADLFGILGSSPSIGRTFTADEDLPGADDVAVLAHGLWQRRFGGSPDVVGTTVQVDGLDRTVIGVMPPSFKLPADLGSEQPSELWLPLALDPEDLGGRGSHYLQAVGLLALGATGAQADAELAVLTRRWVADGLVRDESFSAFTVPIREEVLGDVRPALLILFGAVGFILLIACVNVANLLLARADERRSELAIRTALGAGRGRIASQLFTESLVLAALGGAVAVFLAAVGLEVIAGLAPPGIPGMDGVALDARVLVFTMGIALLSGLVFGAIPARQIARRDLTGSLKDGGRNATSGRDRQRVRNSLVMAEVALAVVLVIGAGLLMRSFWEMRQVVLGFEPENVLALQLTLPQADYQSSEAMVGFYEELGARVADLPGVRSAGAAALLPLHQTVGDWGIDIEGRERAPGEAFQGYLQIVTPGYFETMGIPVIAGRAVESADRGDGLPSVVINERMAARYWPGGSGIGQRIRIRQEQQGAWFTVVGIVGDIRHNAIVEEPRHEMYFPHAQLPLALGGTTSAMNLVVRTEADPLALAASVREAVGSLDPNLPVANVRTMERVVDRALADARFTMVLLGAFGALALLLGAVGIYGVIAHGVNRRKQEFAIRMALGANRRVILRMVVLEALAVVGVGIGFGLFAAYGVTRALGSLLYGVSTTDATTFIAVAVLLAGVAIAAAILPARWATRLEPAILLRAD